MKIKRTMVFLLLLLFGCFLFIACGEEEGKEEEHGTAEETQTEIQNAIEEHTETKELRQEDPEDYYPEMVPPSVSSCDGLTNAALSRAHWSTPYGGSLTVETGDDGNYLRFTGIGQSWHSPAFDLYPYIRQKGTYTVSLRYMAEGNIPASVSPFHLAIRGTKENDFMKDNGGNVYTNVADCPSGCRAGTWYDISFTFSVSENDLGIKDTWNLCFHMIDAAVTGICVDDLCVKYLAIEEPEVFLPENAQTWVMNEMIFRSDKEREDPVSEAELDLVLSCGDTVLTVPGFWDGGRTWRIRYALPEAGEWTWKTVCTDPDDSGLHGLEGKVFCRAYDGDLEIYRRGFLTISDGNRYFTYADGTPFLYLGDTHWTMFTEEFDIPGDHAGDTGAESHFRYIADQRVKQGFTVYQSEPIGSGINVTNGITDADILSFRNMDRYFAYLAECGLVHANAEFFYPSEMAQWQKHENFDEELRIAARYWVARYSAYPVLWTLGQETDKNFYGVFDTETNPYHKLCAYIDTYDPLHHPISAHQENTGSVKASDSSFRDVSGHSWYASQWSPALNGVESFSAPKDYWLNGQGKPVVLYESLYDYLWTDHYGARAEGWLGFLNGMYGYGYGAVDIWYYHSTYDADKDSVNHGIKITVEDKAVPWCESAEFESAWQAGYMLDFLSEIEWWKLTPRFDDAAWFRADTGTYYSAASDGNDTYVIYLYNMKSKSLTGKVCGLDPVAEYTLHWFNPRTGEWGEEISFTAPDGIYKLPYKPDKEDWAALIQKQ